MAGADDPRPSSPDGAEQDVLGLVAVYVTDRSGFADALTSTTRDPVALADAASRLAAEAVGAGDLHAAEGAYQVLTAALDGAGDHRGMLDAAITTAEVMKVRADTVPEYESARQYAESLAGAARRMRRPASAFRALVHVADCSYFAAEELRGAGDQVGWHRGMLATLRDCVTVLDVMEAGLAVPEMPHFVDLLAAVADRTMSLHWFDDDDGEDRTEVSGALRDIALAVETFVPTDVVPDADRARVVGLFGPLAALSYAHGSPDHAAKRLIAALRVAEEAGDPELALEALAARYHGERASRRSSEHLASLRAELRGACDVLRSSHRSRAGRLRAAELLDSTTGPMLRDEFGDRLGTDVVAALHAMEVNKARVLLDEMAHLTRRATSPDVRRQLVAEETRLLHLEAHPERGEADSEFRLLTRMPYGPLGRANLMDGALASLEQRYAVEDAGFVGSAPVAALPDVVAALRPGEALISYQLPYHPLDPAGHLVVLLITPAGALSLDLPLNYDGELGVIGRLQVDGRQPLDVSPLGNLIAMVRLAIRQGRDAEIAADLQQLYRVLIAPLADYGVVPEHFTRLVVVPSGVLHAVPFAALLDEEGRYLIDRVEVVVAPSVSVWERLARREVRTPTRFLGLADPELADGWEPLPASRREVEQVSTLLADVDVRVRYGEAATESAFVSEAPGAGIVHLATHGDFPEEDAVDLHRVLLAPEGEHDGRLHAEEIRGMDLSAAELVVLSVCDGALYRFGPGDEPLGLASAFLTAGVGALLAPQWEIDDEATARWMIEFYRLLGAQGPAAALRSASCELRHQGAQIRDWGGFALMGTGRPWP